MGKANFIVSLRAEFWILYPRSVNYVTATFHNFNIIAGFLRPSTHTHMVR